MSALGHLFAPDREHISKHPLLLEELTRPLPVTLGINWYEAFDRPVQRADRSWHFPDVSKGESLGKIRGGHCGALVQMGGIAILAQNPHWWAFYNQGPEGACDGFGHCKSQSLLRGGTYDGFWLYNQARKLEGTFPNGEGTTGRSVCQVLKSTGLRTQPGAVASHDESLDGPVTLTLGIAAYRWATMVDDVLAALGRPGAQAVPFSNNWGEDAPLVTWLPVATLARVLAEEGEADVVTDR